MTIRQTILSVFEQRKERDIRDALTTTSIVLDSDLNSMAFAVIVTRRFLNKPIKRWSLGGSLPTDRLVAGAEAVLAGLPVKARSRHPIEAQCRTGSVSALQRLGAASGSLPCAGRSRRPE